LSQRGATPLKTWIDEKSNSQWQESKFHKHEIVQIKRDGTDTNDVVRERDIPKDAKQVKKTDVWLEDIPRTSQRHTLPNMEQVDCITNSMLVSDNSMRCHLYTLTVTQSQSQSNDDTNSNGGGDAEEDGKQVEIETDVKRDVFYRIKRKLRELAPCHFDNMHVFSFAANAPKEIRVDKVPAPYSNYTVLLTQQKSTSSSSSSSAPSQSGGAFSTVYKDCNVQFQAQGLNILNRERFRNSNYVKLARTEDKYYNLEHIDRCDVFEQRGCDLQFPDLLCVNGYKSTIGFTSNQTILKTLTCRKLICKHSLYDLIDRFGVAAVDKFIRRKRAVTNYSNQIVELHGLDETMNLDSTFDRQDGSQMSFREYYENKTYHRNNSKKIKLLESQEQALVISHQYDGKGRDKTLSRTLYFLPQLLHVIVPMELQTDETKNKMRALAHPEIRDIVAATKKINDKLNAMQRTCLFQTEAECLRVRGYMLRPPLVCFKTCRGMHKVSALQFGGHEWKNVNAFSYDLREVYGGGANDGPSRRSSTPSQPIQWAILFDPSLTRHGCDQQILNALDTFKSKRRFEFDPFGQPQVLKRDFRELGPLREELRRSQFSVVLCILPEQNDSKIKLDITRHTLFSEQPSTALTTPNVSPSKKSAKRNQAFDFQFVCERNMHKQNALFNVFESILLKSKVILYHLELELPAKVYDYNRCWMIGIKILRKKGGAHLVNISCNRAPFVGALKFITNHSAFISGESDVVPLNVMYQACKKLLKDAVRKVRQSDGEESIPTNIIILRSNGSEGQTRSIVSKELCGFKRALNALDWNAAVPAVQFTVLQENCADSVGVINQRHDQEQFAYSDKAMVVNDTITSTSQFDFYMVLPQKQERTIYGRTLRFILLSDDYSDGSGTETRLRISQHSGLLADFMTIIYDSLWSYSLHIPFPKVPNFPAPIKFAEHYAEWRWGTLTTEDSNMKDLEINIDSAKPKIIELRASSNSESHTPPITTIGQDNDVNMQ